MNVAVARRQFKAAIDAAQNWRKEAIEDYEFYYGKQWDDSDLRALADQGRPAITINKTRPLVNLLSGYQRLNRYEPEFLPRTKDDLELCKVRKGMTKYVFDQNDYETQESRVFLDGIIGGRGWLSTGYKQVAETSELEVAIARESPFNLYLDPECREPDISDAEYIDRARWVPKSELTLAYPEHADAINAVIDLYDKDERTQEYVFTDPLWFQKDRKKLRLVEHWYKQRVRETVFILQDGSEIKQKDMQINMMQYIAYTSERLVKQIRVMVFFDEVELEDKLSPYEHGEFPFVQFIAYYTGEGEDVPAGIVRALKDPQREINKRRSQTLHIINTQANSGWLVDEGALTAQQKRLFKDFGAMPGIILEKTTGGNVQRIEPPNMPAGVMQTEQQVHLDVREISGINEAMLGADNAAAVSGRAIELRQKQAVTHVATLFDNLRVTKRQLLFQLWGRRGQKGLVQQCYTEQKTFRVLGDNGQAEFMTVNQPVVDPLTGTIRTVLNDLSVGEFDIVITDTPSTATQRLAQFYTMLEAAKQGLPIPPDMIVAASDWPQREEIAKRMIEAQQQQQPQPKITQSINFRDLPPAGQAQMAANAGIQLSPADALISQFNELPPEQQMLVLQQIMNLLNQQAPSSPPPPQETQQQQGMNAYNLAQQRNPNPAQVMEMMRPVL